MENQHTVTQEVEFFNLLSQYPYDLEKSNSILQNDPRSKLFPLYSHYAYLENTTPNMTSIYSDFSSKMQPKSAEEHLVYARALFCLKDPGFMQAMMIASESGLLIAQKMMGSFYCSGEKISGLQSDFEKGLDLLERTSDAGLSSAQYELGNLYFNGFGTLKRDLGKAQEWFLKSASSGFSQGKYMAYYVEYQRMQPTKKDGNSPADLPYFHLLQEACAEGDPNAILFVEKDDKGFKNDFPSEIKFAVLKRGIILHKKNNEMRKGLTDLFVRTRYANKIHNKENFTFLYDLLQELLKETPENLDVTWDLYRLLDEHQKYASTEQKRPKDGVMQLIYKCASEGHVGSVLRLLIEENPKADNYLPIAFMKNPRRALKVFPEYLNDTKYQDLIKRTLSNNPLLIEYCEIPIRSNLTIMSEVVTRNRFCVKWLHKYYQYGAYEEFPVIYMASNGMYPLLRPEMEKLYLDLAFGFEQGSCKVLSKQDYINLFHKLTCNGEYSQIMEICRTNLKDTPNDMFFTCALCEASIALNDLNPKGSIVIKPDLLCFPSHPCDEDLFQQSRYQWKVLAPFDDDYGFQSIEVIKFQEDLKKHDFAPSRMLLAHVSNGSYEIDDSTLISYAEQGWNEANLLLGASLMKHKSLLAVPYLIKCNNRKSFIMLADHYQISGNLADAEYYYERAAWNGSNRGMKRMAILSTQTMQEGNAKFWSDRFLTSNSSRDVNSPVELEKEEKDLWDIVLDMRSFLENRKLYQGVPNNCWICIKEMIQLCRQYLQGIVTSRNPEMALKIINTLLSAEHILDEDRCKIHLMLVENFPQDPQRHSSIEKIVKLRQDFSELSNQVFKVLPYDDLYCYSLHYIMFLVKNELETVTSLFKNPHFILDVCERYNMINGSNKGHTLVKYLQKCMIACHGVSNRVFASDIKHFVPNVTLSGMESLFNKYQLESMPRRVDSQHFFELRGPMTEKLPESTAFSFDSGNFGEALSFEKEDSAGNTFSFQGLSFDTKSDSTDFTFQNDQDLTISTQNKSERTNKRSIKMTKK